MGYFVFSHLFAETAIIGPCFCHPPLCRSAPCSHFYVPSLRYQELLLASSAPTGNIFVIFLLGAFMKTFEDTKFGKNLIKILGTFHEALNTFVSFAIEMGKQNHQLGSGVLGTFACHERRLLSPSCLFLLSSVRLSVCLHVSALLPLVVYL